MVDFKAHVLDRMDIVARARRLYAAFRDDPKAQEEEDSAAVSDAFLSLLAAYDAVVGERDRAIGQCHKNTSEIIDLKAKLTEAERRAEAKSREWQKAEARADGLAAALEKMLDESADD